MSQAPLEVAQYVETTFSWLDEKVSVHALDKCVVDSSIQTMPPSMKEERSFFGISQIIKDCSVFYSIGYVVYYFIY